MQTPAKRKRNDENQSPFSFVNYAGPPTAKRARAPRRTVLTDITPDIRAAAENVYAEKAKERASGEAEKKRLFEVERQAGDTRRLEASIQHMKDQGYNTLFSFMSSLLQTKDRNLSSQVSRLLSDHGSELVSMMETRNPHLLDKRMTEKFRALLTTEARALTQLLQPERRGNISVALTSFSLSTILEDANSVAPNLVECLSVLVESESRVEGKGRKKKEVVCQYPVFSTH